MGLAGKQLRRHAFVWGMAEPILQAVAETARRVADGS